MQGRRRLGVAREPVRAYTAVQRPDRRQSDAEQLGLEDLQQPDLRHRRIPTAQACGAYVVRDLGASLGKSDAPALTRVLGAAHRPGQSQRSRGLRSAGLHQGRRRRSRRVRLPRHLQSLVDTVTPADVVWTCRLLSRLSDEQWNAAFCAAGYPPDSGGALHRQAQVEDCGRTRAGDEVTPSKIDCPEPTRISHHRRRRTRRALRGRAPEAARSRSAGRRSCSAASTRSVSSAAIDDIVVALPPELWPPIRPTICGRGRKPVVVVEGGERRQDSVRRAFARVDRHADVVVIHDAARPLVTDALIAAHRGCGRRDGAAIAALRATDTVKRGDAARRIVETLPREEIYPGADAAGVSDGRAARCAGDVARRCHR